MNHKTVPLFRMQKLIYQAQSGVRLDKFLTQEYNINWNIAQKLIRDGRVLLNGRKTHNHRQHLQENDSIECMDEKLRAEIRENTRQIGPHAYAALKSMILYENDHIIVLNKEHGYASQGGANCEHNIPDILKCYIKGFYIVHRLDQLASGLLIIAKNKDAAAKISGQFQEKIDLQKHYLAIVQGQPDRAKNIINSALMFNKNNQKSQITGTENNMKAARTIYETFKTIKFQAQEYSLLKVQIIEGRKHQIRAHLSQVLNTPILFDQRYGFQFNSENRMLQEELFGKEQGIMLQAYRLELKNFPIQIKETVISKQGSLKHKNNTIILQAGLSEAFQRFFNKFQIDGL